MIIKPARFFLKSLNSGCLFFKAGLPALLMPALVAALPLAHAETINQDGVKLAITAQEKSIAVSISAITVEGAAVFGVENPARIVIDLPQLRSKRSRSFPAAAGSVNGVRFGSHPDKLRIVLDLSSSQLPLIRQQAEKTELKIELLESVEAAPTPSLRPIETATPSPSAMPSPTAPPALTDTPFLAPTPSPLAVSSPAPVEKTAPTITPTPLIQPPTDLTSALPGGPIAVARFEFGYLPEDQSPVLKIGLSQRAEYKLSRSDQKTFQLIIPNSHLAGKYLTLPHFPPGDFTGLNSVQARPLRNDVEISIGVDLGTRLASFVKENEIWVRTLNK